MITALVIIMDATETIAKGIGGVIALLIIIIVVVLFIAMVIWVTNATFDRDHKWFDK